MTDALFDEKVILQLAVGDRRRAARFVHAFVRSLPDYSHKLAVALEQKRLDELRDHAHQLAGAAAYCGASPLSRSAKKLDDMARECSAGELAELVEEVRTQITGLLGLGLDRFR